MIEILLKSLGLTILIETLFVWAWGISDWKDLILVGLCSVLTNPVVVYLVYQMNAFDLKIIILILESLAIFVEGWVLSCYASTIHHPWRLALMMNAFSYFVGVIIQ